MISLAQRLRRLPSIDTSITATGGTVTEADGYRIHTFTSSGMFTVVSGTNEVEYLIVGGGGGGSDDGYNIRYGGGGGSGGYLTGLFTVIAETSYPIIIGAGGAGGLNGGALNSLGYQGYNSSVFSKVAGGGGAGCAHLDSPYAGSWDNCDRYSPRNGYTVGGSGKYGNHLGASGLGSVYSGYDGGDGLLLFGSYYGGGGGGYAHPDGGWCVSGYCVGEGGAGGGGNANDAGAGYPGVTNSGSGGGGGRYGGGNGGSGIVIVRYPI